MGIKTKRVETYKLKFRIKVKSPKKTNLIRETSLINNL